MKLGIDLGGTNMRVGLVDGDTIIRKEIVPCPSRESETVVLEALADLIGRNMSDKVSGIGIGVPTLVDAQRGIVYNATNIPSWREVHLKDFLTLRFGVEVAVNNDANCFALGEARFGLGRNCNGLVGVTLGTGVGGGLVIDGRLYGGRNTGAAEIGELPFKGHNFEYYCSSVFFEREYGISGKDAAVAARDGKPEAIAIWRDFGANVGELMKAVMFAYDPDVIVIGGGIASAFSLYEETMKETLASFPYPESLRNIIIAPSRLDDVSILAASALTE
ncbi:MAG: ROK family protein [Muribaculaceae bacterium]|nr:ROK family protein [Muribaculaceae bacterium]